MRPFCSPGACDGCPDRVVCRCFGVPEAAVVEAITTLGLRTIKEIRKHTDAGDGCTCCHAQLHRLLEENAAVLTAEAG